MAKAKGGAVNIRESGMTVAGKRGAPAESRGVLDRLRGLGGGYYDSAPPDEAESLLPDADSFDFKSAQDDEFARSGGTYAPSRDSLRDSAGSALRKLLHLDDREHGQQRELREMQERGLTERAKLDADAQMQRAGVPYFSPVQTGGGVQSFDHRTGSVVGRVGDLKPGETAQKDLANVGNTLWRAQKVRNMFKPEWTGPRQGRLSTMETALIGNDAEKAEFQSYLEGLRNTVVNLRTGAQMSEHEAQRILAEVPGFNLPPVTFKARLDAATKGLEDWYARRNALATGRPGEAPPLPAQVGGAPATPQPDITTRAATSARDLINKYRR